ncbi:MAG: DUF3788 family protein [Ignavibacteriales bacterium]
MNKAQQLLRDANIRPTAEIIADGLGRANNTYIKFVDGLKKDDILLMDWRYYKDGKAWLSKGEYKWTTARGTNKVKPIFWLSIWDGFFKISFFFSTGVRDELLTLPISQEAKKIIKNAVPMGKTMRFIPIVFDVNADKQLEDLFVLAQFRKENL